MSTLRRASAVTAFLCTLALAAFALVLGAVPAANARTDDAPPSGDAAQSIAWVDQNYRRPLSLPDITWDNPTAQAATAHVHYWVLNGIGTFHEEEPGKPGFTGVEPWDRCLAVGAAPCGEVAFEELQLPDAVAGWLDTPYHGLPFLDSQNFGCAESKVGSVCDMSVDSDPFGGQTPDERAAVNTPASPVRMWPYEGATGVPTVWTGGESPNPLANYTGKGAVGPTLFVGTVTAVTASLRDAKGATVLLLAPGAATATPTLRVGGGYDGVIGWNAVFAAQELKPNTAYTFTVTDDAGQSWTTHFTTIAEDTGMEVDVDTEGHDVSVLVQAGPAKTAAVTISDPNGHELARANVKINRPWAWPGFHRGGTFVVCADLPSLGAYGAAHDCQKATFTASTSGLLTLGQSVYHSATAIVTLHAAGVLLGRRATVTLIANFRGGCGPACGGWPRSRNQHFTLTLRPTQTFRMPFQSGGGWTAGVSVSVPAFTANGARYAQTLFNGGFGR